MRRWLRVAAAAWLFLLAACATYEAVTTAPEEFWITAENILWALWADICTAVDLLL